jgi:hypothetical protein
MRKLLFSLLLATTVATPVLAAGPDQSDRSQARQERKAERSEARQERAQVREDRSQARPEVREQARPQPIQRSEAPVREIVRERVVRDDRPVMPAANFNDRGRPSVDQRQDPRGNGNWRQQQRDAAQRQMQDRRDQRDVTQQQIEQRAERNRLRVPIGARPDRPAPVPQTAYNNQNRHSQWRTDWRRDHRYDWHNYRNQHRSIFRLGAYFDPFGWGYHRYNIGWRLWPSYYSSNYWLNDPYMYRLPYAPFPYKWVRYYDDALLVDTFSGQVVDVMYDFFW